MYTSNADSCLTVVCGILFATDELLWVVKVAVGARTDFVDGLQTQSAVCLPRAFRRTYGGVKIDEDGSWNVFAVASLGEESLESATLFCVHRVLV